MYRVSAPDGRSVATALVSAGLARATGLGPEVSALAAAEAKARQEKTGCVWGGPLPTASASGGGAFVAQAAAHVPDNFPERRRGDPRHAAWPGLPDSPLHRGLPARR